MAIAPKIKVPPPPNYLAILDELLKNKLFDIVNERIKLWGLNISIEDGKLVDQSNSTDAWLRRFITQHPLMMQMKDEVRKLAKEQDEVLIIGETGTGKEIIARALHDDRSGEFIPVNCAGLPETLIESLLFGHMKGSFTGATDTRVGYFQAAKDGTIFLDEIGELPLGVQAKFLRAIQERCVTKVGSSESEKINCRIVCATNRDLNKMMNENLFRKDLYARISTFEVKILSISSRPCDIHPIIESLPGGPEFLIAAKDKTITCPYNVRSLQQHVKRFKVLGRLP